MENFEDYLEIQKNKIENEKLLLQNKNRNKINENPLDDCDKDVRFLKTEICKSNTDSNIICENGGVEKNLENLARLVTISNTSIKDLETNVISEIPEMSSCYQNMGYSNPNNSFYNKNSNLQHNAKHNFSKEDNHLKNNDLNFKFAGGDVSMLHEKEISHNKQNNWTRRNKNDDMEQWISDTFYSYFPSLNAEQTKRENNNRGRQLDYQNYLKKIANSENQTIESKDKDFQNLNNANLTRNADKSEMEIIVTTNPNYENPLKQRENYNQTALRPSSTRDRLLEDLKHTELSNIIYGDAAQRRKQAEAEREIQKKKEYQRDLMRQIEEKRREIELLKEKEKMEDENLTRKLEEQLKTIKLQEELEREKIKTERAKFEIERNKIIREQLISKLEKDKLQVKPPESSSCETKSENEKELHDAFLVDKNKNEVYRFFTNSAQDYRKPFQNHVSTDAFDDFVNSSSANEQILLDSPNFDSFVRNEHTPLLPIDCAHGNRKICPFCEIKLKNYESWCPSCKQQILDDGAENRTMLCENCENQYLICSACDKKKIICEFCHRKRNICASCTRKFCVHCGNSIKPNIKSKLKTSKTDLVNNQMSAVPSEHSFQILELSNSENHEVPINNSKHSKLSNNLDRAMKFSTNYSTNSIFNPENKSLNSSYFEFGVRNGEIVVNNRIYNNTHKRTLNKNLPNGVKKATADNKTKTKLNIENTSLNEMPLLREVPKKFTLKNKNETKHKLYRDFKSTNSSIDDLSRKWEVPAVEKRTISTNSPIVLTQLGAVRRQLQMERLQAEISN